MAETAVHFGAGNIGRGFVAQFPHEADLIAEIAAADIVTTAVGAGILQFVAPAIAKRPAARTNPEPLVVIAGENVIGGTDLLAAEVRKHDPAANAIFANCAIDRIVPQQDGGLDVTIESCFEWVVDRTPFHGSTPDIVGVSWVDDLEPFIERKLFTVNTAHAAAELAERGPEVWNLLNAVGVALRFDVEGDAESVELQAMLRSGATADSLAVSITGLEPTHPHFPHVVEVIELRLAR